MWMGLLGRLHDPAVLPPGKGLGTGDWVGIGTSLEGYR